MEVDIQKQFIKEFTTEYAKNKKWYRFGKMSGKIIFENQMYGKIGAFVQGLENSQGFYDVFFREKCENKPLELDYHNAIRLWEYVFEFYEKEIKEAVLSFNGLKSSEKTPKLTIKTYNFEEKDVVFLSFYRACYNDSDYYAIPKDIALSLCLEDYDEEEVGRGDSLWEQLEPYLIKEDFMFKGKCIKVYNYD